MSKLPAIGNNLTKARKTRYPNDTQIDFSARIGVSKATYVKMEKGDLSVGMDKYFRAAQLLDLQGSFEHLFELEENILDA